MRHTIYMLVTRGLMPDAAWDVIKEGYPDTSRELFNAQWNAAMHAFHGLSK